MILQIFSILGLVVLLFVHAEVMDWPFYDLGWLLHLAAGFLLAMFFRVTFKKSKIWQSLIFVGVIGMGWEFFEHFYYLAPQWITPDGWNDVFWGVAGGAVFLGIEFLVRRIKKSGS